MPKAGSVSTTRRRVARAERAQTIEAANPRRPNLAIVSSQKARDGSRGAVLQGVARLMRQYEANPVGMEWIALVLVMHTAETRYERLHEVAVRKSGVLA